MRERIPLLALVLLAAACPRTLEPGPPPPSAPLPPTTSDNSQDPLRVPTELRLRKVRQISFGGRALSPVFSRDSKRLAYLAVPAASSKPDAGLPPAAPHLFDVLRFAELPLPSGALDGGTFTDLWLTPSGEPCGDLSTLPCGSSLAGCRVDSTRELGLASCTPPHWPLTRAGPCATTTSGDWACLLIAASGTQLWLWPSGAEVPHPLDSGTGDDADPVFSPKGKMLAWSSTRGEYAGIPGGRTPSGIEVLPAAQFGHPPQLQSIAPPGQANLHPSFMPGGDSIVFASNADDASGRDMDIFRAGADGHDLERITFAPGADIDPAVSPDGHWLAWVSERNAALPGEQDLMIAEWVE